MLSFNINKTYRSDYYVSQIQCEGEIGNGQILGINGPSGSGKTTVLRAIAGLENIDFGQIDYNNDSLLNITTENRPISMVFQDFPLFPAMNALKMMNYLCQEVDHELIELLEISNVLKKLPREMSGGQKQRVAISVALMSDSELVLMDEPFSALGEESIRRVIRAIHLYQGKGKTFVIASHRVDILEQIAQTIVSPS